VPRDPTTDVLLEVLDRAFDEPSWHGPNLCGSIKNLSAKQASWRPGPGRHSMAEQVVHAAYWKYAARRRLRGDKRGSFPVKGSNWFDFPDGLDDEGWRLFTALLWSVHGVLREAVAGFDPRRLDDPLPGGRGASKTTARMLILGVAAHDVYHAGQIQLLKRLREGAERET
jgi:hypothetical protein